MLTPNPFAILMLLAWAPLTWWLFSRYRPSLAAAVSFVGATMTLPELWGFPLPILPDIGKNHIPAMAAFAYVAIAQSQRLKAARPMRGVDLFFLLMIIGHAGTVVTNPLPTGEGPEPNNGLTFRDFVSMVVQDVIEVYLPFLLGRTLFRSGRDLRDLIVVFAFGATLYVVPGLWEWRMSPLLHRGIYGYLCNFIFQSKRGDVWRPSVMMTHGLVFARFILVGMIAAAVLWRSKLKVSRLPALPVWLGLLGFQLLCRSTGAIILSAAVLPVVLMLSPRWQGRFAYSIGLVVVLYPLLTANGWFPKDEILDFAESIEPARAESLAARFEQEEQLDEKISARPWFGWGEYLRTHIYDERTGADLTVVDGEWLIVYSKRGLIGFIAWFGLYVTPILLAVRAIAKSTGKEQRLLAGTAVLMSMFAVEMIPNSKGSLPQFFTAGALLGAVQGILHAPRRTRVRSRRPSQRPEAEALEAEAPEPAPEVIVTPIPNSASRT